MRMQTGLISLCACVIIWFANVEWVYLKRKPLLYPPKDAKRLVFGYNETASDFFWLRVVQDIDMCEQSSEPPGVPRLYKPKELQNQPSRCHLGWVFRMLDTVTELTPRFIIPYQFGAPMLSFIIDDREGAKIIFDKGVARFPNDWQILYRAAYHYHFEILDSNKAAHLYLRAAQNGAPNWLVGLASRLFNSGGNRQAAIRVLQDEATKTKDPRWREGLLKRIENLKKQPD